MDRKKKLICILHQTYRVLYSSGALKSVRSRLILIRFREVCQKEWSSHALFHLFYTLTLLSGIFLILILRMKKELSFRENTLGFSLKCKEFIPVCAYSPASSLL